MKWEGQLNDPYIYTHKICWWFLHIHNIISKITQLHHVTAVILIQYVTTATCKCDEHCFEYRSSKLAVIWCILCDISQQLREWHSTSMVEISTDVAFRDLFPQPNSSKMAVIWHTSTHHNHFDWRATGIGCRLQYRFWVHIIGKLYMICISRWKKSNHATDILLQEPQ